MKILNNLKIQVLKELKDTKRFILNCMQWRWKQQNEECEKGFHKSVKPQKSNQYYLLIQQLHL